MVDMGFGLMNLKILTTLGCFGTLLSTRFDTDTISYSKFKARERKAKMADLEKKLKNLQVQCDQDPSLENVNKLEILKTEYDLQYEYLAQGAIIRSRARWYEQGEKGNKYFLNLESSRGKKSTIRKIFREDKSLTTNPKIIMDELKGFYSNLYQANSSRGRLLSQERARTQTFRSTEREM